MSSPMAGRVTVIVFSKDRALQLDATLRSFYLHCVDALQVAQVTVLYKTTHSRHASQYRELQIAYPYVNFLAERNFRRDLLDLLCPPCVNRALYRLVSALNAFGFRPGTRPDQLVRLLLDPLRFAFNKRLFPLPQEAPAVLFLVDDNLFVRDFSLGNCLSALARQTDAIGFSLRLGPNTIYNYMADRPQPLPEFTPAVDDILSFHWTEASMNFGYPFEVSSSFYPLDVILPLLLTISFHNPNRLEAALSMRAGFFRRSHPRLLCLVQSVTFCNPINLVQAEFSNRAGKEYSIDELSERFARGERIDVAAYSGFIPNACHQEVGLNFIQVGLR